MVTTIAVTRLSLCVSCSPTRFNFMLDLCSSLSCPYLLAAGYALQIGLTGETYEDSARTRRRETFFAGAATVYTRRSSSSPPD